MASGVGGKGGCGRGGHVESDVEVELRETGVGGSGRGGGEVGATAPSASDGADELASPRGGSAE